MTTLNYANLKTYMNKLESGSEHTIRFTNIVRTDGLFILLQEADNGKVISFNKTHIYNKLRMNFKLQLENDMTYHIYESDVKEFLGAKSRQEQENILKRVTYNGQPVGIISKSKLHNLLAPLIKSDVDYKITVVDTTSPDSYWLSIDGLGIAIWSTALTSGTISFTIDDDIKNTRTFYSESGDLMQSLHKGSILISYVKSDHINTYTDGYVLSALIRGENRPIENKRILRCGYNRTSDKLMAKIWFFDDVLKDLRGDDLGLHTGHVSTIQSFKDKLYLACDALEQSEKYYRVGENLRKYLDDFN